MANTTLFALAALAVIAGFRATRRARRYSRGQCLACGYNLRGAKHEQCPECGVRVDGRNPWIDTLLTRTFAIAGLLSLGVITTIAVAWACAAWVNIGNSEPQRGWTSPPPTDWLILRYDRFGATRIVWVVDNDAYDNMRYRNNDPGTAPRSEQEWERINRWAKQKQTEFAAFRPELMPRWGDMRHRLNDDSVIQSVGMSYLEDARGWPFRCLWWTAEMHMTTLTLAPHNLHLFDGRSREHVYGGIALDNPSRANALQTQVLPLRIIWQGFIANSLLYILTWLILILLISRWLRRNRTPASA